MPEGNQRKNHMIWSSRKHHGQKIHMKLYRKPQKKKQEWESIREEIQKKSIGSVAEKKILWKKHLEKSIISNPRKKAHRESMRNLIRSHRQSIKLQGDKSQEKQVSEETCSYDMIKSFNVMHRFSHLVFLAVTFVFLCLPLTTQGLNGLLCRASLSKC